MLCSCAEDYDEHGMMTVAAYQSAALHWIELGANIIGGCCGIGPSHMAAITASLLS